MVVGLICAGLLSCQQLVCLLNFTNETLPTLNRGVQEIRPGSYRNRNREIAITTPAYCDIRWTSTPNAGIPFCAGITATCLFPICIAASLHSSKQLPPAHLPALQAPTGYGFHTSKSQSRRWLERQCCKPS